MPMAPTMEEAQRKRAEEQQNQARGTNKPPNWNGPVNVPGPSGGDTGTRENQNRGNNRGRRRPDEPIPQGPNPRPTPTAGPAGPPIDMPTPTAGPMPTGPYSTQPPAPTGPFSSQMPSMAPTGPMSTPANPWSGPGGTPFPSSQPAPSGNPNTPEYNNFANNLLNNPALGPRQNTPSGPGLPPPPPVDTRGHGHGGGRGRGVGGAGATGESVAANAGDAAAYHGGEWWDVPAVTQQTLFGGGYGRQLSDLLQALGFEPGAFLGQNGFPTSWRVPAQFAGGPEATALLNRLPQEYLALLDSFFTDLFGYPNVIPDQTAPAPVNAPVPQAPGGWTGAPVQPNPTAPDRTPRPLVPVNG